MPDAPGGSFASLSGLRDRAQGERDERLAAEKVAKEEEAKKKAAAETKAEPDKPKPIVHFSALHGELTEDQLLEKYPTVVEQVKNKNYLLQGFATFDIKLGNSSLSLRSLRKSEQRVISLLSEGEIDKEGNQIYHPDDINRWSLVFALAKVGQQHFEPIPVPSVGASKRFADETKTSLSKLTASEEVGKRTSIIDNWSVPVFQMVLANFLDMSAAYQRAIMQDMRNPS